MGSGREGSRTVNDDTPRCTCGRFVRQVSAFSGEGGQELVTLECSEHGRWTEGY